MKCPLCEIEDTQQRIRSPQFYNCPNCGSVFRSPEHYISAEEEKARYLTHNNNVEDERYQNFVSPIVKAVTHSFDYQSSGLDFGAGTGPVISKLLTDKGYQMTLWDPFFHPDRSVLDSRYDFIVCCEVMEHFHHPKEEFLLMKRLLKPNGKLFCKTELLTPKKDFEDWYYKNDTTHVIFYSPQNLLWIKEHLGYARLYVGRDLIVFDL
ncbi:MAG: class I SAM-dependent methyltransferase [Bacteroidota bacterium]